MFGSAAASLGSWWPFRGAAAPSPAPPPDPELFQRPVATVKKLYFYPLKSGHRIEVDSFDCLMRGPAYDRYVCGSVSLARPEMPGQKDSDRLAPLSTLSTIC